MIRVLHEDNDDKSSSSGSQQEQQRQEESLKVKQQREETKIHWDTLLSTFGLSSVVTVLANIFPVLNVIPIFNFLIPSASEWGWFLSPTLSYVGQGIIMGVPTTLSMLLGAFVGWGILGPIAKSSGWADGPINDWKTGAKGWILWISLGVMISESLINLGILTYKEVKNFIVKYKLLGYSEVNKDLSSDNNDNSENEEPIIPNWLLITGLALSFLLCLVSIKYLFHNIPISSILISILLGCLLSILAVRSLGETDLNPVSGIGKVSQIVFGGLLPGNIVANLVAGGIAEAGAQQAGDMMQDLQTGHLLHSSPRAQFIGQLLGSFVSVFISVFAYQLYNQVYTIPGPEFPVPTAQVWLDMARLVNGEPLPKNSLPFTILFSLIFTLFPIIQEFWPNYTPLHYLPNGIAFAVGIYNPPNFTLPRVLGAVISDLYLKGYFTKLWAYIKHKAGKHDSMCEFPDEAGESEMECLNPDHCHTRKREYRSPSFYRVWCTVIASGLVLGEGTMALVVLIVKAIF
jgi:OPT family oligopeptide transporter